MKVKVIEKFIDKHTGEVHHIGDELSITKERFDEIVEKGKFVEAIETKAKAPKQSK